MIDATGFYGELVHYVFVCFFFFSTLLIFFYCKRQGALDFDETPKIEMMREGD